MGERGPGKDGQRSRRRSSQQAPEGAVFSGGRGWAEASGPLDKIFSPQRAVVYHSREKNHTLTNADTRSQGHCAGSACVLPIFPTRRGSGAPGSPLQAPARPQQLLLCGFTFLYFPLTCQDFFCLFLVFLKKLRLWGHHGEGRMGCSSSLLHAGGRTGQLVEEQVGVAGTHLAGGHGGDAVERAGQVSLAAWGARDTQLGQHEGPSLTYWTPGSPARGPSHLESLKVCHSPVTGLRQ